MLRSYGVYEACRAREVANLIRGVRASNGQASGGREQQAIERGKRCITGKWLRRVDPVREWGRELDIALRDANVGGRRPVIRYQTASITN
jgi:hypothetical protein